jgi:hypothetical protein
VIVDIVWRRQAGTGTKTLITAGSTVIFDFHDVVSYSGLVADPDLYPRRALTAEFKTDSATKKFGDMSHLDGRELESVSNSWLDPNTHTSLEKGQQKGGSNWDQFEVCDVFLSFFFVFFYFFFFFIL